MRNCSDRIQNTVNKIRYSKYGGGGVFAGTKVYELLGDHKLYTLYSVSDQLIIAGDDEDDIYFSQRVRR